MSTKQVAIITGASSGLGEGLAIALAGRGIRVGLLARRLDRLKNLEERINNSGGEAFAVACDVSQEDDVKAAHREIVSRFGEVDLLIVNAGIALNMGRDILNPSMLEQIYRVNLFGPIYSIQEVLPGMLQRRKVTSLPSLAWLPFVDTQSSKDIAGVSQRSIVNWSVCETASIKRGTCHHDLPWFYSHRTHRKNAGQSAFF